jgi:hypothetical protein
MLYKVMLQQHQLARHHHLLVTRVTMPRTILYLHQASQGDLQQPIKLCYRLEGQQAFNHTKGQISFILEYVCFIIIFHIIIK